MPQDDDIFVAHSPTVLSVLSLTNREPPPPRYPPRVVSHTDQFEVSPPSSPEDTFQIDQDPTDGDNDLQFAISLEDSGDNPLGDLDLGMDDLSIY